MILAIVLVTLGVWFWVVLVGYVNPKDAGDRKDVVQTFALIVAGVVAAITAAVGLLNLRLTRRNLEQQRQLDQQHVQEDALQDYIEQIGTLLAEQCLKKAKPEDDAALVARAHTLTTLRRLDKDRKRDVLLFLYEADLIRREHPIVDLSDADLSEANLRGVYLRGADLHRANLEHANLDDAEFRGALLTGAQLDDATLHYARLQGADLSGPKRWDEAREDFTLPLHEQGYGAICRRADFKRAYLEDADLNNVILASAKLEGTLFHNADLSGAFLERATGITNEVLDRDAKSLKGASMPNEQRYERWLLDRGNRSEHLTDREKAHVEEYANWLKDKEVRGEDLPLGASGFLKEYANWLLDRGNRGEDLTDRQKAHVEEEATLLIRLVKDKESRGEDSPSAVWAFLDKYARWLRYREGRGADLTDKEKAFLNWLKEKEGRGENGENSGPS